MARWLLLSLLCAVCLADIYMHNPRGSNDRNCEKDVNRQNANRLFDSQNNAAGGYACPYQPGRTGAGDTMYYYTGSKLKIEWAAQHGCGTGRTRCDIILQYMCSSDLRDGTPTSPNKDDGTDRIPDDKAQSANTAYGMHENYDYYQQCKQRSRNKGLWIADRNVGDNGGATRTRQNNNGDRHGFECPEERDYYPYWHPSPWRDIAIFTDDTSRCTVLKNQSQNVAAKGYCVAPKALDSGKLPNNPAACQASNYTWTTAPSWGIDAPDCLGHTFSRENHLGNVATLAGAVPAFASYMWTIPATVPTNMPCVVRVRYNITGGDIPTQFPGTYVDYRNNSDSKAKTTSPITQDPYVNYTDKNLLLAIKINSNQYGRTFQDRTYAFKFQPRPSSVPVGADIINLNVRGKRGNIVQVYPSVEYDFVPNDLTVTAGTALHIQWVGSDYNPRRGPNDAEGGPADPVNNVNENARTDRHNLVETLPGPKYYPDRIFPMANDTLIAANTMFVAADGQTADVATIKKLSFLGQTNCLTYQELTAKGANKDQLERDSRNCAKINTANNYFDGGIVTLRKTGVFHYMCTRNSNPSNRDQRGKITVTAPAKRSEEQATNPPPPSDADAVVSPLANANTDYENPPPKEQALVDAINKLTLPTQMYAENDVAGHGVKTWMATVQQAISEIVAATKVQYAATANDPATATSPPSDSQSPSSSSSSGLSSGAAAGVGIGCAIGGLLVGSIAVVMIKKRSGPSGNKVLLH